MGVALGALIGSNASRVPIRNAALRTELRTDIRAPSRFSAVEGRLSTVEQRLARTEGLLEGLRDALASRDMPSPGAQGEAS